MPVIARFFGMIIKMFFSNAEHNPPHIHVVYGEYNATFNIIDGKMIVGDFPPKAISLIEEWISLHRDELLDMWNKQEFKPLPPLQ